jgi:hypothetical protein
VVAGSAKAKIKKLRLVDGRLQVVGFHVDEPKCTKSSIAWRRRSARSNETKIFWGKVISLMMQ